MPDVTAHRPIDSLVHSMVLHSIIENGAAPSNSALASATTSTRVDIEAALVRLAANHALVLHPGSLEVWVAHPFSTTPTLFWVENTRRGWWAPCIWCALGVAWLVEGPTRIHTSIGGQSEQLVIDFVAGDLRPRGLLAHFPIPVARAWDNVHRHCACSLVFRSREQIASWCAMHSIRQGEIVLVEKVSELAKAWYSGHLERDWVKATAKQAAQRFEGVGLRGEHWRVPGVDEPF